MKEFKWICNTRLFILTSLIFILPNILYANSISTKINKTFDWVDISQDQYIDNLTNCQLQIKKFNWDKTIWPKENKDIKPPFNEVNQYENIREQVLNSLKSQYILENKYGVTITANMLQADINRMINNSKDAIGLKQLFSLLNNNPDTIAQCISRPYLVKTKILQRFNWDDEIHSEKQINAQTEWQDFLVHKEKNLISAEISTVTYIKKADSSFVNKSEFNQAIELDEIEFSKKSQLNNSIEEDRYDFRVNEIVSQSQNSLIMKSYSWQKETLDNWLLLQNNNMHKYSNENFPYSLPKFNSNAQHPLVRSNTALEDSWVSQVTPDSKSDHTAIWTGVEMIVWGDIQSNKGNIYTPSTDSWRSINTSSAPSKRRYHSAVWTGTEMIIWGGNKSFTTAYTNTGGRYNPITDTWIPTSNIEVPNARQDHTAVWTGSKMMIWGGFDGSYLNTGSLYDPITNSWSVGGVDTINAPVGRRGHTAVWTSTEVIIWGGIDGPLLSNLLDSGARYNPTSNTWTDTSAINAPSKRSSHTAVWTGIEMVVWGGQNNNTGGRYNPTTNTWLQTNSIDAPQGRGSHTAIWTGSEMILWGGDNLTTGGLYNPASDTWTPTSLIDAPSARNDHTAIWTGSEMIVWGGISGNRLNSGGRYDPTNDNWSSTSINDSPSSRRFHTAVWTGNEMIVWGGDSSGSTNTGGSYNPVTDSWLNTNITGAPSARSFHTAIWTGSEMVIWGGDTVTGGRYNPNTDSWQATSFVNAPTGRNQHTAIWTGEEMIIWGGIDGLGETNTGGRYNPNTDTWQISATSLIDAPSIRFNHQSLWTGTQMIVWGGRGENSNLNTGGRYDPILDTWIATDTTSPNLPTTSSTYKSIWTGTEMIVWNGSGRRYNPITDIWSPINTVDEPSTRSSHSLIWTGTEMIVWGGNITGPINTNTGGRYDPINDLWVETSTQSAPESRNSHTAIWTGNEMIVWAGFYSGSSSSGASMGIYYPYNTYSISGTVSGLTGGQLTLQNSISDGLINTTNDLIIDSNGGFTFSKTLVEGSDYSVSVLSDPVSPIHTCTVTNDSGLNISNDINNVSVNCVVESFDIGVTVTGLDPNNTIELTTNSQSLVFNSNTSANFPTQINDGTDYAVILTSQPSSPNQECTITGGNGGNNDGSGTLSGTNAVIEVNCVYVYSISGTVFGLNGDQVVLQNDGTDDLTVNTNGSFEFNTAIEQGSNYAVTVITNPQSPAQTCTVTNGSGMNIMVDIGDVIVNCVNDFFNIGVTVTGLAAGNSVLLENNGGDLLMVNANNTLTNFSTLVANGLNYLITIDSQPTTPNQTCSIEKGEESGTVNAADVNVSINCITNQYFIGGTVSGLLDQNYLVILLNGNHEKTISANGIYLFDMPLLDEQQYNVTIDLPAQNPIQPCIIINNSSTLIGMDIIDVDINCEIGTDFIYENGFEP